MFLILKIKLPENTENCEKEDMNRKLENKRNIFKYN